MAAIHMEAGCLRLTVEPELGAGIADFSVKGPSGYHSPIMRRACPGETNPSQLGSFFMAPWCNRIAGATFEFGGRVHRLKPTTVDGMAQHGDVRKRAWRVVESSGRHAKLEFDSRAASEVNWPWAFRCLAAYRLEGDDTGGLLQIDLSVFNVSTERWPAGCGHHPYFARRLWDDGDVLVVKAPVTGRYPLNRGCATGAAADDRLSARLREGGPIPDEHVDAVFAGFSGRATLRWPASGVTLDIEASRNLGHLVYYVPHAHPDRTSPMAFIAVEPQSQVNNALNVEQVPGVGSVVLEAGSGLETSCQFRVVIDR